MFAIQIAAIQQGQRVSDWAQGFLAATATLDEVQRKCLLPAYVRRSPEEALLAAEAAKEESLEKALERLEELIDGRTSPVEAMRKFLSARPSPLSPPAGYLKVLADSAGKAGIGIMPAWLKFCTDTEGGAKLHNKVKDKIKSSTTFMELANWVSELGNPAMLKPIVTKEETFVLSQSPSHSQSSMDERMARMEEQMKRLMPSSNESSEEECAMVCFGCGLEGHIRKNCKVKCKKCGKRGHSAKTCRKGKQL